MRFVGTAIDEFLKALRVDGASAATTSSYFTALVAFADSLPPDTLVQEITVDHVRGYLDSISHQAVRTRRHRTSVVRSFLAFLRSEGHIVDNPAERIRAPKAPSIYDVRRSADVTAADVQALLGACQTWREAVTFALLAYTGVRRNAAAFLRWRDVDLVEGTYTVREKGDRWETRPMPSELVSLLAAAHREYQPEPDAYVIPPSAREAAGTCKRANRIVYYIVGTVAERAHVRCHPHALRGAFAVRFLADNPDQLVALQSLLGHASIETTMIYVRRANREALMQPVRSLSWAAPRGDLADDTRRHLERAKRATPGDTIRTCDSSSAGGLPGLPTPTAARSDDPAVPAGRPRRYGKWAPLAPRMIIPGMPVRLLLPGGEKRDIVRHDGWAL